MRHTISAPAAILSLAAYPLASIPAWAAIPCAIQLAPPAAILHLAALSATPQEKTLQKGSGDSCNEKGDKEKVA